MTVKLMKTNIEEIKGVLTRTTDQLLLSLNGMCAEGWVDDMPNIETLLLLYRALADHCREEEITLRVEQEQRQQQLDEEFEKQMQQAIEHNKAAEEAAATTH